MVKVVIAHLTSGDVGKADNDTKIEVTKPLAHNLYKNKKIITSTIAICVFFLYNPSLYKK